MMGLATGRFSVLRGSTLNDYGDEVDGTTPALSGIGGSVIERSRKVFNPADGRVSTIRELTGRFPHGTDIQDGDRIKDEKTGEIFVVAAVYRGSNAIVPSDVVTDLTLV